MNGLEQVKAYARLRGDELQPGELVDVRQLGRCEVLAVLPEGMVRLRTAERCPVIVKRVICERVR